MCFQHAGKPQPKVKEDLPQVKRVLDHNSIQYFVDEHGIAYDKNGTPKGTVVEETLTLFETEEG
jgi:hypothetical protein